MVACLSLVLLSIPGCSPDSVIGPAGDPPSSLPAVVDSGQVTDLAVSVVTDSSVTVAWTEVDDGSGQPATYRLKYALPPIDWQSGAVGCDRTIIGVQVGARMSCTVQGLAESTEYDFQVMSYRTRNAVWVGAVYSNVAKGVTSAPSSPGVADLTVVSSTDSTLDLRWTQVDDGAGQPAKYRVKYATPTMTDWSNAVIGCSRAIDGTAIGADMTCSIGGLTASTAYEVQLMSYRMDASGAWADALYSNVASGSTATPTAPPQSAGVTDLMVTATSATSVALSWTQVEDGTGAPADYRVKYALPSIDYGSATIGCSRTIAGTAVGAAMSCTVQGLAPGTTYEVQIMSYGTDSSGAWQNAQYSNVVTVTTLAGTVAQASRDGIWISAAELAARPTSGADWDQLLSDAGRDPGVADIGDQDSRHDVYTLAAALVCVRTGQYCAKARQGVLDAMYTEEDPSDADGDWIPKARWMAVGRNLGSYVIAADLLDLRRGGSTGTDGDRVQAWIESFLTKDLMDSNDRTLQRGWEPLSSGANGAIQQGFAYAAVVAYLRDRSRLDFIWQAFRTFVCDPGAVDVANIYLTPPIRDGWTDAASPCAVNPKGSTMRVPSGLRGAGGTYRIDGSLSADMRRGGVFQWEPGYTQYPWVGLEGLIPAAVVLERAGYPAFAAGDQAVLRTHEYLWWLRNQTGDARWFDGVRSTEIVHLVNVVYDERFPVNETPGRGRTVGYTGWTHPDW